MRPMEDCIMILIIQEGPIYFGFSSSVACGGIKRRHSTTLRNPSGCSPSLLLRLLNTMYAVRYAHANCAFGTTSHTPGTLNGIGGKGRS